MELIYDTDINVKGSAIRLVFKLSAHYSHECVKGRLISLFLELITTHNEELAKRVSTLTGEILTKLEPFITKAGNFITVLNKSFTEYGVHKNDEIRRNLAVNLVFIAEILDSRNFLENYKGIFASFLLSDKAKEIRMISIEKLPQILRIIGPENSHKSFKATIIKLLKEEDKEVLKKFLEFFSEILQSLTVTNPASGFEDQNIVNLLNFLRFSDKLSLYQ